ncbi:MAG: patatin-like phospholipase family protein [Gemmatimonadaceae bacterium]
MPPALTLRAGPDALRIIRERGLRAEDVDVVPGASGGAKWIVLAGLDQFLFGEFFAGERTRPLHLIGSSIGAWRMAAFAQRDPVAALDRTLSAYIYDQHYSPKPSAREVTAVGLQVLDVLLGEHGAEEILGNRSKHVHIITTEGRGLAASNRRLVLLASMLAAAAGNLLSRRTLGLQMRRYIFHTAGDRSPFTALSDFATTHVPLTRENIRPALLATASIPLVLEGVRIPGTPGVHWDGGVLDYHLDMNFGAGEGLVLYPHFYSHVVPGWFDKSLSWRRAPVANFRRALIIAPSDEFVAALPGGKIPDRKDFYTFAEAERIPRWEKARDASARLGDELRELLASGRFAERVKPW